MTPFEITALAILGSHAAGTLALLVRISRDVGRMRADVDHLEARFELLKSSVQLRLGYLGGK